MARRPDPNDARAKRLLITRKGRKLVACAEQASLQIERELRARIGAPALTEFKAGCTKLFHALVAAREPLPDRDPAAMLPLSVAGLATYCERTLMELDRARGYEDLKMSYAQVLTHVSPHGTLINDLARINGVSKQAIGQVVKQVEEAGYVQRRQHPLDKRSTMIFLTDAGLRLIRDSLDNVARIEMDFARVLGNRSAKRFAATLEALSTHLDGGSLPTEGNDVERSPETLLHRAMEQLYIESSESERIRLFNRAGNKAKLSTIALRMLDRLQIQLAD
jgi:DNA-binding MarR family transcriptional regulator